MHEDLVFESTQTMTQAAFAAWVMERERWDPLHHYELLNGRVVMTPPAGYPHGRIEGNVVPLLANFVRGRGLGIVFGSSQGFELSTGDTLEPDASFVSRERWDAGPPPEEGKFLRVVPDLVVEIVSPGTRSRDRSEKRAAYAKAGVREYWMIDVRARTLTLVNGEGAGFTEERAFAPGERFASRVLAGLEAGVDDLFA